MSDAEYTGPLNFAVFAVPEGADLAGAATEIRELAVGHRAEILDIELLSRSGSRQPLPFDLDLAETDLLHDDDLADIAADLADGEQALVVVYEDRTLAGLSAHVAAVSGRELWAGGIDAGDLDSAAAGRENEH